MTKHMFTSKKHISPILFSSLKLMLCISMITTISCKKEDGNSKNLFASCCTNDATTFEDGDRRYAIPTLTTDNGDGINDVFRMFYSAVTENDTMVSLRIFDDENVLIFESSLKAIKSQTQLWDGFITSGPEAGEKYRGTFSYECIIRGPSGPAITLNGGACMVSEACDARENLTNCVFGTQHNGAGDFNRNLPSLEACE